MKRPDLRNTLLCAVMALAAIALTIPIAECGFNDDWSYTKTALDLAQTGHLVYNGWAAAMLGAQAYWGAMFIKLFGFSFLVVRLSTAPLAAGCAALLYALHRRANLPPNLAIFGILTLILSPFFVPHAASFMTDIPALFLLLASIYGYVRAAQALQIAGGGSEPPASWPPRFLGWLLFALVSSLLGGTIRQIDWIVPVVAPVFFLIRQRPFRRFRLVLFLLTISALAAISVALGLSFWFSDQPYTVQEKITDAFPLLLSSTGPRFLCLETAAILLTLGIMTMPILVVIPLLYRKWLERHCSVNARIWCARMIDAVLGLFALTAFLNKWSFPWLGNTFMIFPYLTGTSPMPPMPVSPNFPLAFWKMFDVCAIALVGGSLVLGIVAVLWRSGKASKGATPAPMSSVFALFGMFAIAYIPLLLLKGLRPDPDRLYDRYLLPVLPLVTIGLLGVFYRWTGRSRLPFPAWLGLALFAFYGVAQTHDYFAQLRARLVVTDYLEQRGVSRTRIMAGFEYDGWTQITVAGYYNDPRIQKPKGLYLSPPESIGFATMYQLWEYTPAVHPDYVVARFPYPDLSGTDVPATEFCCWLKPFRRQLTLQVSDPALAAVKSLPIRSNP